jgi:hypothetical protein
MAHVACMSRHAQLAGAGRAVGGPGGGGKGERRRGHCNLLLRRRSSSTMHSPATLPVPHRQPHTRTHTATHAHTHARGARGEARLGPQRWGGEGGGGATGANATCPVRPQCPQWAPRQRGGWRSLQASAATAAATAAPGRSLAPLAPLGGLLTPPWRPVSWSLRPPCTRSSGSRTTPDTWAQRREEGGGRRKEAVVEPLDEAVGRRR